MLIGAIVHDGEAEIARGHSKLVAGDHVVVFAMSQTVNEASRLFS